VYNQYTPNQTFGDDTSTHQHQQTFGVHNSARLHTSTLLLVISLTNLVRNSRDLNQSTIQVQATTGIVDQATEY